jgi:arylsulfatase A-like enzyme
MSLYKQLYRLGVINGFFFALLMLGLDALAYQGFAFMGETSDRVADFAFNHFSKEIIQSLVLVVGVYFFVFVTQALVLRGMLALAFPGLRGLKLGLSLLLAQLLIHTLIVARAAMLWPQYFEEFLKPCGEFFTWFAAIFSPHYIEILAAALAIVWVVLVNRRLVRFPAYRRYLNLVFVVVIAAIVILNVSRVWHSPKAPLEAEPQREVILIVVDSLRSDRLFGSTAGPMFFLRELTARRGIAFPNAYVQLPRTFPSWVSMLSSTYPKQNHIRTMFPTVEDRAHPPPMLTDILNQAGFHTAVYADFAGDIFTRYPFNFFETQAPYFNFLTLVHLRVLEATVQIFPYLENAWGRALFPEIREMANHALPELLTDELLEGIDRNVAAHRSGFSVVFYSTSHFPYAAPYPFYKQFARPDYGGPHRFQRGNYYSGIQPTDADIAQIRGLYDGGLAAVDCELLRLVKALRARGLDKRTTLIITADHGENLFEDGLGIGHGDHLLGEYTLRVPLIIIDLGNPDGSGHVEERGVRSLDIAPTILDLVGLNAPSSFEGISILDPNKKDLVLPILFETGLWFVEKSNEPHQLLRFSYPSIDTMLRVRADNNFEIELQDQYRQVVEFAKHLGFVWGDRKLLYLPMRPRPQYRLYDVKNDPDALHDLADVEPERLQELKERMLTLMRRMGSVEEHNGYLYWNDQ